MVGNPIVVLIGATVFSLCSTSIIHNVSKGTLFHGGWKMRTVHFKKLSLFVMLLVSSSLSQSEKTLWGRN